MVADGWVIPILRPTRSNSMTNIHIEEPQQVEQKKPISILQEYYKLAYAEILYRWGLLYNRVEILKHLSTPSEMHKGVEFLTDCQVCCVPTRGSNCSICKRMSLICVVCHLSVRGSANFCVVCGHGGHTQHLREWFEKYRICASGCGCSCLLETASLFTP